MFLEARAPPADAEGSVTDDLVFRIGLSMSGAISAGAYTAGVFDFLIEALDAWEKARASDPYDGPEGRTVIAALVGASAGAITAGIGTLALARHAHRRRGAPGCRSEPRRPLSPAAALRRLGGQSRTWCRPRANRTSCPSRT